MGEVKQEVGRFVLEAYSKVQEKRRVVRVALAMERRPAAERERSGTVRKTTVARRPEGK